MTTDLLRVAADIEEIVEREVTALKEMGDMGANEIKQLETLSKILDHAIERRRGILPENENASLSDEELEKSLA